MLNLKIIGYYDHSNLGDQQYKRSFVDLFKNYLKCDYTLDFYDCDKIKDISFKESDVIILGGGDVLNNYFLDTIITKFTNKNNKILAVSVGIPYIDILIKTDKLNIIDYIFLRTTIDIELLEKYFAKNKVFYLPDISYILSPNYNIQVLNANYAKVSSLQSIDNYKKLITNKPVNKYLKSYVDNLKKVRLNKKIVCFSLSRHIFNKNYGNEYNLIINSLAKFILYLISNNYHILFINFNTNSINPNENDSIISSDVIQNLYTLQNNNKIKDNITFIDKTLQSNDIISLFNLVDVCFPMRFHAVLFSIYCNVPIIPIYTTRKISNLLLELNWDISYELKKNELDIPINLDIDLLIKKFTQLTKLIDSRTIYDKLLNINTYRFNKYFSTNINHFMNILDQEIFVNKNSNISIVQNLIEKTYNHVQEFSQSKGYPDYRLITDDYLQNMITYIICYNLLDKSINTIYNYGLKEKIFNINIEYDHNTEWRWILNDYINKKILLHNTDETVNQLNLINIKYIDQNDYSGCHRSGWQYVYNYLEMLHNDSNDLFVDLYVDRTFHWNYDINKMLNIIPYKQSWVGFIHHTFDKSFSEYNCYNLLNCSEFLESLKICKGLIVLSDYLKNKLESELKNLEINVKVYKLTHPTDFDVIKFSYSNFYNNKDKKLIHIGGWLRNVYSFYNLTLPNQTSFKYGFLLGNKTNIPLKHLKCKIKKVALKGKNMTNYYPEKNFLHNLHTILNKNCSKERGIYINSNSSVTIKNKYKRYGQYYVNYPNCSTNHKTLSIPLEVQQNCSSNNLCLDDNNDNDDCNWNRYPLNIEYSLITGITNNWNKHFYEDMYKKINEVDYITFLENNDYDKLLSENIVFINLVDASAINTVLECIVRTTPIIVNKHPAVIELLGQSYPLYYNTDQDIDKDQNNTENMFIEIYNLLKNDDSIKKAHKYLKNLNKDKFKIQTFINNFIKIIKNEI